MGVCKWEFGRQKHRHTASCLPCVHDSGYISMMYCKDHACLASGNRLLRNKRLQTAYCVHIRALQPRRRAEDGGISQPTGEVKELRDCAILLLGGARRACGSL